MTHQTVFLWEKSWWRILRPKDFHCLFELMWFDFRSHSASSSYSLEYLLQFFTLCSSPSSTPPCSLLSLSSPSLGSTQTNIPDKWNRYIAKNHTINGTGIQPKTIPDKLKRLQQKTIPYEWNRYTAKNHTRQMEQVYVQQKTILNKWNRYA